MENMMALWMFAAVFVVLLSGFPVAFALSGTALAFAGLGLLLGNFDIAFLNALPNRLYGIIGNETLIAVPLFVFMGVMLERSRIAESLLEAMTDLFGTLRGGLGIAVTLVGMLMAASTGIVGATVVTMGLLSLPTMLRKNYDPAVACGTICASGTLGQMIPPSIVLVLLGDIISTAYQQAQLDMGVFAPESISVGDLFAGALLPGLGLVAMYLVYIALLAWLRPNLMPAAEQNARLEPGFYRSLLFSLAPPLILILSVLGSIIGGLATPTEAASVGAFGAIILAFAKCELNLATLQEVMRSTTQTTSMVFLILIGAALFSLVFRGFEGDELIVNLLSDLPGGQFGAVFSVMLVMFFLGFVLDFIEITFVVVPIVGPVLLAMGIDPVWLGIMIALNLQTSFLTPPFGFALFYLRGVAPAEVSTGQIYKGVMPFIAIQLIMLAVLAYWPQLATWLPTQIYNDAL
ncbi:TRAP transporter large permease [Methylotuvimicrobium buryatense]|uniref:TRAP transporter large permease protein n=1 Tax=Methylotuvimicrobium buryatense TaxID=95641 RepID=A0A4P9UNU4_METBY|nr:TRAP transporter large permease subunit [Methylotuvimicrobium buryatense]QCW83034.1 TRAP transporter large permease subunit [Methylotuvimicrobium buryatense]